MHIVTFQFQGQVRLGAQIGASILDLNKTNPEIPADISLFLSGGESLMDLANKTIVSADNSQLISANDVTLLAPLPHPAKILCIGHNYAGHTDNKTELPEFPNMFCKTTNTIIGHEQFICLPPVSSQVEYEAELAVVIGKRGYDIPESKAMDYVAGYSIFNDVSARDYQNRSSQWLLGKSFDTFGPFGPALVTKDEVPDPHCLDLVLTVNGLPKQRANTRDLIFSVPFLISYLSQVMTLDPGDILITGTPAKLPEADHPRRFLEAGDVVEISIEKLGILRNTVMAAISNR